MRASSNNVSDLLSKHICIDRTLVFAIVFPYEMLEDVVVVLLLSYVSSLERVVRRAVAKEIGWCHEQGSVSEVFCEVKGENSTLISCCGI